MLSDADVQAIAVRVEGARATLAVNAVTVNRRTPLDDLDALLADRGALVAQVGRLRAVALWAQLVVDHSPIRDMDGWEGVECVPMEWENALHSLAAALREGRSDG